MRQSPTCRKNPEFEIQRDFFTEIRYRAGQYPELAWTHSSQNGIWTTAAQAGKAKASGLTKGVWDVFHPFPHGKYLGLWIEFKAPGKGLTAEQVAFRKALWPVGYAFIVSQNSEAAWNSLEAYIKLGPFRGMI